MVATRGQDTEQQCNEKLTPLSLAIIAASRFKTGSRLEIRLQTVGARGGFEGKGSVSIFLNQLAEKCTRLTWKADWLKCVARGAIIGVRDLPLARGPTWATNEWAQDGPGPTGPNESPKCHCQNLFFETLHSPKYAKSNEEVPARLVFPAANPLETNSGYYRTAMSGSTVYKGAARSLKLMSKRLHEFFEKIQKT